MHVNKKAQTQLNTTAFLLYGNAVAIAVAFAVSLVDMVAPFSRFSSYATLSHVVLLISTSMAPKGKTLHILPQHFAACMRRDATNISLVNVV